MCHVLIEVAESENEVDEVNILLLFALTIPFDFCLHTCEFLEKRGLKDKEVRGFRDEMVSLASTSKNCYSFVTTQFTRQTVINSFVKIFSLGSSSHVSSFYYQSLWKCCDKLKNWYVYQLAFIYN